MNKLWILVTFIITSCLNNDNKPLNSNECECKPTKIKKANSRWNDSLIYLTQVYKNDSSKFIYCNNNTSDSAELTDHLLIWNSRPIAKLSDIKKEYSLTKTVLNSDSIRQIDYFWVTQEKKILTTGIRLMLNKNSKKIYVNNCYFLSNKFMTLDDWIKWDNLPDLPE